MRGEDYDTGRLSEDEKTERGRKTMTGEDYERGGQREDS